jgi:membrane fusion protein, multidrug efflux system
MSNELYHDIFLEPAKTTKPPIPPTNGTGDQNHKEKGGQLLHLPQPEPKQSTPRRKIALGALAIAALLAIGTVTTLAIRSTPAKPEKADRKGRNQITPVIVAKVTRKNVPIQVSAIGRVQSEATVSITPQVGGRITKVFFKKGDTVRKGQLLFTLDNRTQTAGIQQAQGTVLKDQGAVQQARANLEKSQGAVKQARANLEKDKGLILQAQATIEKDQGAIQQAQATLQKDQGLVRQAQATLNKNMAQAKFAKSQSERYTTLYKQGAVSKDQQQQYNANNAAQAATLQADREAIANAQAVVRGDIIAIKNAQSVLKGDMAALENARTSLKSSEIAIANAQAVVKGDIAAIANAQAVVGSDRGALNNAQVQASYTQVVAPIDGQAGNILIPEGNIVQANSTNPVVIIQKINPIQVSFAVPETNLGEIQSSTQGGKLKVDVNFTGSTKPIPGLLSFVNNTVDSTTGTIQLIGDFDNADGQLFPGQFVNATLTLREEPNATVVPAQAVQNGANGQFVFVVKPDSTVENVPVTASLSVDGVNMIKKGSLKPGDEVVIDGQANLVTGSKIRVKDPNAPNDGGSAAEEEKDPSAGQKGDSSGGRSGRSRRNRGEASAEASPSQSPTGEKP